MKKTWRAISFIAVIVFAVSVIEYETPIVVLDMAGDIFGALALVLLGINQQFE